MKLSPYEKHSPKKDLLNEAGRLTSATVACTLWLLFWGTAGRSAVHGLSLAVLGLIVFEILSLANLLAFTSVAALSPKLLTKRKALLIGTGKRARMLRDNLTSHAAPIEIVGCVDDEVVDGDLGGLSYLGPISSLSQLLQSHPIEVVLIGLPLRSKYDEIQRVIDTCESVGVESQYQMDIFATERVRVQAHAETPHDFNVLTDFSPRPTQHVKRLIDIVGASTVLVLTSPLLVAAAIAVRLSSPGPIFFVQQRYGRHRKRFPMYKFRSMVVDAEVKQAALEAQNEAQGPVFKLKRDPRVTAVGAFLRKTSIDELPQLFNVLRGEMSLVGPRPLPLRDVSRFEEAWLFRRFSVRPGLTCIWQVNGRSNTSFDSWIKQDLEYIDGWSLALDMNILVRTVPAVLRGSGAV